MVQSTIGGVTKFDKKHSGKFLNHPLHPFEISYLLYDIFKISRKV